ncbi:hypothetical protein M1446_02040 [Candidatus Dependentiae bacterium]|nr:hypothetical protein [Candidatus Dependentiae bacterium]
MNKFFLILCLLINTNLFSRSPESADPSPSLDLQETAYKFGEYVLTKISWEAIGKAAKIMSPFLLSLMKDKNTYYIVPAEGPLVASTNHLAYLPHIQHEADKLRLTVPQIAKKHVSALQIENFTKAPIQAHDTQYVTLKQAKIAGITGLLAIIGYKCYKNRKKIASKFDDFRVKLAQKLTPKKRSWMTF